MPAGCIRERNGRFYVRTRALVIDPRDGSSRWRQIEKAAGPSRRKAERMLRSLQDDVQDGRYVPSSVTVLELGRRWLTEHAQVNLKPATAAAYRETLYLHIAPALGHTRLDDLHPHMIKALLGKKRAQGLSEETVAKIRRHLHALLAFAQDTGLLSVNPAESARARGGHATRRRARGTQLTPVQIKRFLEECPPRWRAFFTVALDTGLRRGELIGLRWEDIDLLQRILHVRRSISAYDQMHMTSGQGELTTKTEAGQRLVPILDGAQQALEELYKTAADKSEHAPVFATIERKRGRDGIMRPTGRPLNPRMVTRVFRRYADRAGLPCTIRLHDLRHTAITNAISQGEDILLVAAFAGHAKTSTTVDIYGHLMPDRVRAAAQRMRSVSWAQTASPTGRGEQPPDSAAPLARALEVDIVAARASGEPANDEPIFPRELNSITPNAPGPTGPGATGRPNAPGQGDTDAERADTGPPADGSRHGTRMTRRLMRQIEASSAYTTAPLGQGATASMGEEQASNHQTRSSEQARTDHGARQGAPP